MDTERHRASAGFTLIELLIAVIIVGILSTLALPQFQRAMERARQAEARDMLGHIYQAEKLYFAETNTYINITPTANPTMAAVPPDAAPDTFFTYAVTGATATAFTATATRKIQGNPGRAPSWTSAYTVNIDETGAWTMTGF